MGRGDRRLLFAAAYVYGAQPGNATAAAEAAGYAKHTARSMASRLLTKSDIQAEVARLTAERDAAIKTKGIAELQYRIDAANDRHRLMCQVIAERAADTSLWPVAGGRTGLLVRTPLSGRAYEFVRSTNADGDEPQFPADAYEYAVDTGLLRELRELEKQAAQDMRQGRAEAQPVLPEGTHLREVTFREIIVERPAHSLALPFDVDEDVRESD